MKIISKWKDYYDYLQGIFGVDEKLVLDRTNYKTNINYYDYYIETFFIGGMKIQGIFIKGKWYYGEEILKHTKNNKSKWVERNHSDYYSVYIPYSNRYEIILKYPIIDNHNARENCPIMLGHKRGRTWVYTKNPILKNYDFHKVYTAEQIWVLLTNWLSKEKPIINTQTNKNKIISAGFDLKTSFRK